MKFIPLTKLSKAEQWHMQNPKQPTDLHVNSYIQIRWCQNKLPNRGINLYIDLKKHTCKLDQMAPRNIRISLDKHMPFLQ